MIINIDIRRIVEPQGYLNKVIGVTCVTEVQLKALRMIECNNDRSNKAGAE